MIYSENKMGNLVWFCFQNKFFENQIKKLAWKNVQSNDHSTLHNSQRRKELQFSQTQLSGRSWRNTRYYIFWTSRTFVKSLRTHLLSIFQLKILPPEGSDNCQFIGKIIKCEICWKLWSSLFSLPGKKIKFQSLLVKTVVHDKMPATPHSGFTLWFGNWAPY